MAVEFEVDHSKAMGRMGISKCVKISGGDTSNICFAK